MSIRFPKVTRKNLTLSQIINSGNFHRLACKGENLFMIDTGVFIDLDTQYHGNGKTGEVPAQLLSQLEKDYLLLVTSGVNKEIRTHRESNMRINHREEISQSTAILANCLHKGTTEFFERIGYNYLSREEKDLHRYCVRLAASYAFKSDSRKGYKDRISEPDIEIINTALDIWSATRTSLPEISTINILTTDDHIAKTVNYLKDPLSKTDPLTHETAISSMSFENYGVRVIFTRNKLSSYLSK